MAVEVRPVGGGRTEAKGDLRDTGEMQARRSGDTWGYMVAGVARGMQGEG